MSSWLDNPGGIISLSTRNTRAVVIGNPGFDFTRVGVPISSINTGNLALIGVDPNTFVLHDLYVFDQGLTSMIGLELIAIDLDSLELSELNELSDGLQTERTNIQDQITVLQNERSTLVSDRQSEINTIDGLEIQENNLIIEKEKNQG